MSIDRQNWMRAFQSDSIPLWICPRCKQSALCLVPDSFNSFLTADCEINQSEDWYQPEHDSYRFTALLECNNKSCGEKVTCTGDGFVEFDYYYDKYGDTQTSYEIYYRPKYFNPGLEIFSLPEKTPYLLASVIRKSFELLFTDPEASLNQLRSAIEVLLNELGVDQLDKTGKPLRLHSRLDKLTGMHSKYQKQLEAIKWLGNAGSHNSKAEKLTIDDVLDGYEILQPIVNELFSAQRKSIDDLVLEINTNKGPTKKLSL